jgi:Putative MetA-pathway of phenol degradation
MSKKASSRLSRNWIVFVLVSGAFANSLAAEECSSEATDIATDRPDVTNSSVVVPQGSLQIESGVNWTARQGGPVIDGPASRVRLGVTPCTEVLLDLPNYFHPVRGPGASGFSDLSPGIKHQFGSLPGGFQFSLTAGLELPSGAVRISGPGFGGYIQLPWTKELGDAWSLSGMFTVFWFPGQSRSNPTLEPTLVLERQVGPRADVFIEYFADGPQHGIPSQAINSGGAYRLTSTQQVDFHAGFGLNRESPDYFFGLGYSLRLGGLF